MLPSTAYSLYGLTNRGNYAPDAFKSLIDCLDPAVYSGWSGNGTPDVFDPNFDAVLAFFSFSRRASFACLVIRGAGRLWIRWADSSMQQGRFASHLRIIE
jgi:hypothetical protein